MSAEIVVNTTSTRAVPSGDRSKIDSRSPQSPAAARDNETAASVAIIRIRTFPSASCRKMCRHRDIITAEYDDDYFDAAIPSLLMDMTMATILCSSNICHKGS